MSSSSATKTYQFTSDTKIVLEIVEIDLHIIGIIVRYFEKDIPIDIPSNIELWDKTKIERWRCCQPNSLFPYKHYIISERDEWVSLFHNDKLLDTFCVEIPQPVIKTYSQFYEGERGGEAGGS